MFNADASQFMIFSVLLRKMLVHSHFWICWMLVLLIGSAFCYPHTSACHNNCIGLRICSFYKFINISSCFFWCFCCCCFGFRFLMENYCFVYILSVAIFVFFFVQYFQMHISIQHRSSFNRQNLISRVWCVWHDMHF